MKPYGLGTYLTFVSVCYLFLGGPKRRNKEKPKREPKKTNRITLRIVGEYSLRIIPDYPSFRS